MADILPPVELEFSAAGDPVVIIAETVVSSPTQLSQTAPVFLDPRWAFAYAQMVNHVVQGYDFELIIKPDEFREKYMERYNAEDPAEEVGPGTIRLHNFGVPDFAVIHKPMKNGDELIFFVENIFMGIPYRVTMTEGSAPDYQPIAMVE